MSMSSYVLCKAHVIFTRNYEKCNMKFKSFTGLWTMHNKCYKGKPPCPYEGFNPVFTACSQSPSQLSYLRTLLYDRYDLHWSKMLKTKCEISDSRSNDYEDHCLLDCDTVYIGTKVLEKHNASMIRIEYGGIPFFRMLVSTKLHGIATQQTVIFNEYWIYILLCADIIFLNI